MESRQSKLCLRKRGSSRRNQRFTFVVESDAVTANRDDRTWRVFLLRELERSVVFSKKKMRRWHPDESTYAYREIRSDLFHGIASSLLKENSRVYVFRRGHVFTCLARPSTALKSHAGRMTSDGCEQTGYRPNENR